MSAHGTADWMMVSQRLRADRRSTIAAGVLVLMVALVAIGPLLLQYDPRDQIDIVHLKHARPSLEHLLGTDAYSRDLLSRVLSGGRVSLTVAASAVLLEMAFGVCWGLIAGLTGWWLDALMMRCVDAGLSVPRVLLLLALLATVPQVPLWLLVLIIGATGWFGVARLVRSEVRTIRHVDFILAAQALGATPARLARRHLLPQVIGPVVVWATLAVGQVIALEAGLSWLGVGVQPPDASWGNIIHDGTEFISSAPWVSIAPGVCLVVVVLAVSALGDGLRDALAPRQLPHT